MTVLFEKRINDLRGFLGSGEAALVTDEVNIGYFTGFFHSEGALLVTENSAFLLVDFRYAEAAQKQASGCEVICFQTLSASLTALLTAEGVQCLHAEASHITVSRYEFFRKKCGEQHVDIVADGRLDKHIGSLRVIKTQDELDKIAKAQQIAEAAYSELLNDVRPGVSERELAARLEFYMKQRGAEAVSFDLITITGKKTSLPHGVPSLDTVQEGDFFTCDFGTPGLMALSAASCACKTTA